MQKSTKIAKHNSIMESNVACHKIIENTDVCRHICTFFLFNEMLANMSSLCKDVYHGVVKKEFTMIRSANIYFESRHISLFTASNRWKLSKKAFLNGKLFMSTPNLLGIKLNIDEYEYSSDPVEVMAECMEQNQKLYDSIILAKSLKRLRFCGEEYFCNPKLDIIFNFPLLEILVLDKLKLSYIDTDCLTVKKNIKSLKKLKEIKFIECEYDSPCTISPIYAPTINIVAEYEYEDDERGMFHTLEFNNVDNVIFNGREWLASDWNESRAHYEDCECSECLPTESD